MISASPFEEEQVRVLTPPFDAWPLPDLFLKIWMRWRDWFRLTCSNVVNVDWLRNNSNGITDELSTFMSVIFVCSIISVDLGP